MLFGDAVYQYEYNRAACSVAADILFCFSFNGMSVSVIYNIKKENLQLNNKFSIHN